ncbi:hypothetical protein QBC38DRAFT_371994 [Podospora fimiseda]|uniref:HD/PDEase domain-containing protein n=1 Tax=Podospora fimiseda TaxID=252190 RepID=A0AAN7BIM9_9PEZI|nr:hypothetical protein QBC38DRAFT_371994 [Podospora fimiseda]
MCKTADDVPRGVGTGTITAAVRSLLPNHPVCNEALNLAKSSLPASILYHSFRVYFYAQAFMTIFQDTDPTDPTPASIARAEPHVLFVACILHDIGTSSVYDSVPERFEVVSADVAARLLRSHAIPEPAVRDAWLAMSLHTSPGIAERLGGTVRALRLAVRADFGSYPHPPAEYVPGGAEAMNAIRWQLPRLEVEKELGDSVANQAISDPQKAPKASWPGDLVRAKREHPGWDGVNKGF